MQQTLLQTFQAVVFMTTQFLIKFTHAFSCARVYVLIPCAKLEGGSRTKYEQVQAAQVENWKLNTTFYGPLHFLWCSREKDAKHANGKFVETAKKCKEIA